MDDILKKLNKIKELNLSKFPGIYKEKIRESIRYLLFYKRKSLADEEYINKSMQKYEFSLNIPKQEITVKEYLEKNTLNLYFLNRID